MRVKRDTDIPKKHAWVIHAIFIGFFAVIAMALCHLAFGAGSHVLGIGPDNEQGVWKIGWLSFALSHGVNPLYTSSVGVPGRVVNLMWNNMALPLSIVSVPVTLIFGAITSFNALIVLALWLDATVCYVCLLQFTKRNWVAWVGGMIWAFGPFPFSQLAMGRLPWLCLFMVPVVFVCLARLLDQAFRPTLRFGIIFGLVLATQFLLLEELATTTALMAGIVLVVMTALHREVVIPTILRVWGTVVIAGGVTLAICAYPLAIQFLGPGHNVHGVPISPSLYISALGSFVVPTQYQALRYGQNFTGLQHLAGFQLLAASYLGIPLLVLLILIVIKRRRDPVVQGAAVLVLAAMILSLGSPLHIDGTATSIPLPWALVRHLPFMKLVMPLRFMVFAYLGAVVILARFSAGAWSRRLRLTFLLLTSLTVLTLAPVSAAPTTTISTPQWFSTAHSGWVAVIPSPLMPDGNEALPMVWQVQSDYRFNLMWGFIIQRGSHNQSSSEPPVTVFDRYLAAAQVGHPMRMTQSEETQMRNELLTSWNGVNLVMLPNRHAADVSSLIKTLLGTKPIQTTGAVEWHIS